MIAPSSNINMNVKEFKRFLSGIGETLDRPKIQPSLQAWAEEFVGKIGANFISHRSPDGNAWKPLRRTRPGSRNYRWPHPLIDTGDLLASIVKSGTKGHVEKYEDDNLILGTNLKYASIHQYGAGRIPKREFLGINKALAKMAEDLVNDEIFEQISSLGKSTGHG